MKFSIKLEQTRKELDALPLKYRQALGMAVKKAAYDVEAMAKTLAPVDTGALKNSIQAKPAGHLTWEVAVGQEYGAYQEFGTTTNKAQPFLGPAVEHVRERFLTAVRKILESAAEDTVA